MRELQSSESRARERGVFPRIVADPIRLPCRKQVKSASSRLELGVDRALD